MNTGTTHSTIYSEEYWLKIHDYIIIILVALEVNASVFDGCVCMFANAIQKKHICACKMALNDGFLADVTFYSQYV